MYYDFAVSATQTRHLWVTDILDGTTEILTSVCNCAVTAVCDVGV